MTRIEATKEIQPYKDAVYLKNRQLRIINKLKTLMEDKDNPDNLETIQNYLKFSAEAFISKKEIVDSNANHGNMIEDDDEAQEEQEEFAE